MNTSRLAAFIATYEFQLMALVKAHPSNYYTGFHHDNMPNTAEDYVKSVSEMLEDKLLAGKSIFLGGGAMERTLNSLKIDPNMDSLRFFLRGGTR